MMNDDVRKRLLEQTRFELEAKGVFRLGRCYIFWQSIPGLRASNWERKAWLLTVDRLTDGTKRRLVPVERSDFILHNVNLNQRCKEVYNCTLTPQWI